MDYIQATGRPDRLQKDGNSANFVRGEMENDTPKSWAGLFLSQFIKVQCMLTPLSSVFLELTEVFYECYNYSDENSILASI